VNRFSQTDQEIFAVLLTGDFFALVAFPVAASVRLFRVRKQSATARRDWLFCVLLYATVLFQFAMYIMANEYNDIQIQGKYLLPVWLALCTPTRSSTSSLVSPLACLFRPSLW